MPKANVPSIQPLAVEHRIHVVRGQKVMLDADLAALYGVTTGNLNLAVRRNGARFPEDFMFGLTQNEADSLLLQIARANAGRGGVEVGALLSQTVTAKAGRGGRRTLPYAFTEHGVAMLSSVLNSERAIQVNIMIFRAFVRMRELIAANKDIAARVEKLEQGHDRAASVIEVLVEDIDRLAQDVRKMKALPAPRKRKIGFDL